MNYQQRNRVPIYRDLNALGIFKKELKTSWILPRAYLNKILFYQGKACSFFKSPYK